MCESCESAFPLFSLYEISAPSCSFPYPILWQEASLITSPSPGIKPLRRQIIHKLSPIFIDVLSKSFSLSTIYSALMVSTKCVCTCVCKHSISAAWETSLGWSTVLPSGLHLAVAVYTGLHRSVSNSPTALQLPASLLEDMQQITK